MANLEGWHIDPENRRRFSYHDGRFYTGRWTTDIREVSTPIGIFGKRFFSVKSELLPFIFGALALCGWLFWYLAGMIFGIIGLTLGIKFLRIDRTGLLLTGTILAALGLLLSLAFWIWTLILLS